MTVDIDAIAAQHGGVDLNTIVLPSDEDFGVISDDEDLIIEEEKLVLNESFENMILVDYLPEVSLEKFEKLESVIRKLYSKIGDIKEFFMPVNHDAIQKTLDYCFIEFNTPQEAKLAKEVTDGYKFDRAHILSVNLFDDIDKYMRVPDEWTPPESKPSTSRENLQHWLIDANARDQFVIRAGKDTEVLWNDYRHLKPDPFYKGTSWTDSFVQWSPLGTYLATVHHQGVIVWGGASTFNHIHRFAHPRVTFIDFSPGENYLITYSSHEPSNQLDTNTVVISIFDVKTGKLKRDFRGSAAEFAVGGTGGLNGISWPIFKWAGGRDDKYFARIGKNAVYVYETEMFSLIDKKSIKVGNVMDFSWSPTDPILALFVPELGNQPAKLSLYQIPSKVEMRQKNLFSVSDCKIYWQSNGEYLAAKVDRYTKTRKSSYTGFELFRIKECDIPIEVLELENKNEKIIGFAWEPKGHRFAVIHGHNPRPDISFYSMKTAHHTNRVSKLKTLTSKQANALYWSPGGQFIVLAGLKGFNGQLEFYNVNELETMAITEHFMCTDVEWDPTGRFIATAVTSIHEMENGFNIWSFHGKLLYRVLKDRFFQFSWRPRPPSLLSALEEEEITKNLKKYSKRYESEDQHVSTLLSEQKRDTRRLFKEEWNSWINRWRKYNQDEKIERGMLRDGEVSDVEEEEFGVKEVEYEEVLGVEEEIVTA